MKDQDAPQPIGYFPPIDLSNSASWDEDFAQRIWATQFLSVAPLSRFFLSMRVVYANVAVRILQVLAFAGIAAFLYWATLMPDGSIAQQILIGLSVGSGAFCFTSFFVAAFLAFGHRVSFFLSLLIAASAALAWLTEGVAQNLAVAATTALALCLLLDINLRQLQDSAKTLAQNARSNLDDHDVETENAEDATAPQHYAVGGGTISETMQYDLVGCYRAIRARLGDDYPDDLVMRTIKRAQQLRDNDPDAFAVAENWHAHAHPSG